MHAARVMERLSLAAVAAFILLTGTAEAATVIAHRGSGNGPRENTLASVSIAANQRADWIEADVRRTASLASFVMFHDERLEHVTNCSGRVDGRTTGYIRARCETASGNRVASLSDYLGRVAETRLHLLLELKPGLTDWQAGAIASRVTAKGMGARTTIQSFDIDLLVAGMRAAPAMPAWILTRSFDSPAVARALANGAEGVSIRYDAALANPERVAELQASGKAVAVWTPDEAAAWSGLAQLGVDAIITNRPAALSLWSCAWLNARPAAAELLLVRCCPLRCP